jgi:hypothetical protein
VTKCEGVLAGNRLIDQGMEHLLRCSLGLQCDEALSCGGCLSELSGCLQCHRGYLSYRPNLSQPPCEQPCTNTAIHSLSCGAPGQDGPSHIQVAALLLVMVVSL